MIISFPVHPCLHSLQIWGVAEIYLIIRIVLIYSQILLFFFSLIRYNYIIY